MYIYTWWFSSSEKFVPIIWRWIRCTPAWSLARPTHPRSTGFIRLSAWLGCVSSHIHIHAYDCAGHAGWGSWPGEGERGMPQARPLACHYPRCPFSGSSKPLFSGGFWTATIKATVMWGGHQWRFFQTAGDTEGSSVIVTDSDVVFRRHDFGSRK